MNAKCHRILSLWIYGVVAMGLYVAPRESIAQTPSWERFTIDATLRGADGVRLADANADGRPDIATGWEESGQTRIYLHPGVDRVTQPWPTVTVGSAPAVEDAVWIDLTGDGVLDVLSSCEGQEQALRLHAAPSQPEDLLVAQAWTTTILPVGGGRTRWMYALPFEASGQVSERWQKRLIIGSKAPEAMVGLLQTDTTELPGSEAPSTRASQHWSLVPLCSAEWIMSLEACDVNRDGKLDVVYSDRKGKRSGVYWLENPGLVGPWQQHLVGGLGREVMFLQVLGAKDAPRRQIVVAVKPRHIFLLTEGEDCREPWSVTEIEVGASDRIGTAKAVAAADLTGDGHLEWVFSCEAAEGNRSGLVYLSVGEDIQKWEMHDVSGSEGIKFDRLEIIDLDDDNDLDILTCEERAGGKGLGVIWYANPRHSR